MTLGGAYLDYFVSSVQDEDPQDLTATKIIYTAPVTVNGVSGNLHFSYTYRFDGADEDRAYELNGSYELMGFVPVSDEYDAYMQPLNDGDEIGCGGSTFTYRGQPVVRTAETRAASVAVQIVDLLAPYIRRGSSGSAESGTDQDRKGKTEKTPRKCSGSAPGWLLVIKIYDIIIGRGSV